MPRSLWIDTAKRRLWSDSGEVALAPKPLGVLCALVDAPGEILTRDELERQVWPDVRITDSVLRYTIRQVRQVLEDTPDATGFIETIPRRGWRLTARVSHGGAPGVQRLDPAGEREDAADGSPAAPLRVAGRDEELARLGAALDRARKGTPTLVFVTGEAGIGKTTLVAEFLRRSAPLPDLVVARGECVEHYGSEEPYLPAVEALERLVGTLGESPSVEILRRYAPSWLAQLPGLTTPEERAGLVPQAIGATAARMLREFSGALDQITRRCTVVLAFDDVHWSDAASLELLTHLVRRPAPLRLLLLATLRPAEVAARPGPLAAIKRDLEIHGQCEEVILEGLSQREVDDYLARRFDGDAAEVSRTRVGEFVHRWTEGNPLFMVSVVDQLVARGVVRREDDTWRLDAPFPRDLRAPATIRKLIEEELDRIEPEQRTILETASLAGIEFSAASVAAGAASDVESVEDSCEQLCRSGRFLRPTGRESWPDGTIASRYRFGHALYREILSEGLTAARRARIHREIGMRREAGWGERSSQIAAELAHHFDQAGETDRAMRYFATAGDSAARRFANREAAAYLKRALRLLLAQPRSAERDTAELVVRLAASAPLAATEGYASPDLAENLARVQSLAEPNDADESFMPVLLSLWSLHIVRADVAEARRIGERLLRIARGNPDSVVRLQANRVAGHTAFYAGDLQRARRHLDLALDGYDVSAHAALDYSFGDDPVVLCLSYSSWLNWFQGRSDRAVEDVERALTVADGLEHPPSRALALAYAAVLHQLRRDPARTISSGEALLALADEEALPLWHGLGRIVRGWAWAETGDAGAGIDELRAGLDGWEGTGADLGRPHFVGLLAEALGNAGRTEEAMALLASAGEIIERTGQWVFASERWRLEGEILAASGDRGAADRFQRAIDVARRQGARALALRATVSLSRLALPAAEQREVLRALRTRRRSLEEGGDTRDIQEADALLD